jgi:predicted Zn-ribbon and HTH transcriptional regulator
MGSIIKAICPCGLESEEIMQGIGFNYLERSIQMEPAFCDACGIVIGRDIQKLYSKCPKCRKKMTFYKPETEEEDDEAIGYSFASDNYLQQREKWHCPRCKRETLRFEFMGCWD